MRCCLPHWRRGLAAVVFVPMLKVRDSRTDELGDAIMAQTSVRPGSIALPAVAAAMLYARPSAVKTHMSLKSQAKPAPQGDKPSTAGGSSGARAAAPKSAASADVNRR